MKTLKQLFLMALVMVLPMGFYSCSEEDDGTLKTGYYVSDQNDHDIYFINITSGNTLKKGNGLKYQYWGGQSYNDIPKVTTNVGKTTCYQYWNQLNNTSYTYIIEDDVLYIPSLGEIYTIERGSKVTLRLEGSSLSYTWNH